MRILFKNESEPAIYVVLEKEANTQENASNERKALIFTRERFWKRVNEIKGID